jgi:hypothetical protein
MKNIIYIALFSFALSIMGTSCDNETEMLFEETASQRKTAAVEQFQKALKSSDQGWLFQYFPGEDMSYGGYSYVVKFDDNDSVVVWFEKMSDLTQPYVSLYDVISYGGPVLTFNTYNPYMHYFATPSGAEYNAKGGEYEFLLMSEESGMITMQGTKHGTTILLTKMTEPAEDYMSRVKDIADFIMGASYSATINGTEVSLLEMNRNFIFEYSIDGKDSSNVVPYIVTDTGISFYEEVEILGQNVRDFTLDKENNQLISTEGNVIIDIIFAPIDFTGTYWIIDTETEANRSATFMEVLTQVDEANKVAYPQFPLSKMIFLGQPFEGDDPGFVMGLGPYYIQYYLSFTGVKGHEDYLNIGKIGGGQNWQAVPHVNPLLNLMVDNAPYQVALDDAENPTGYKLTSVENPSIWFIIQ